MGDRNNPSHWKELKSHSQSQLDFTLTSFAGVAFYPQKLQVLYQFEDSFVPG